MKRTLVTFAVLPVLAVASCQTGNRARSNLGTRADSLLGTWELVSYRYGDQPEFIAFPKNRQRFKLFTATHDIWFEFDAATRQIQSGAGGSYTFDGTTLAESKDYAIGSMRSTLGKTHVFTIRLEGDKLSLSGALSDGLRIEEVWKRVK